MKSACWLTAGVMIVLGVLSGCGESQNPSAPDKVLGEAKESTPLRMAGAAVDKGILADPGSYQPTPYDGMSSGSRAGRASDEAAAAATGNAAEQVQRIVTDLGNFVRDGEIELALKLFNPDQVAVLDDDAMDTLFNTYDRIDRLKIALKDKLGDQKANEALAIVYGFQPADVKSEVVGPEQATAQPNLTHLLFGPVKEAPTMALTRANDKWQFTLDAPLTADEAAQITSYHQRLQLALDNITSWVEKQETVDETALTDALTAAAKGEMPKLGGDTDGAEAQPDEPKQEDQPSGLPRGAPGRGRSRRG